MSTRKRNGRKPKQSHSTIHQKANRFKFLVERSFCHGRIKITKQIYEVFGLPDTEGSLGGRIEEN